MLFKSVNWKSRLSIVLGMILLSALFEVVGGSTQNSIAKKIGPVDGLDYTVACYCFPQRHVDPLNEKWGKGWAERQVIQNQLFT